MKHVLTAAAVFAASWLSTGESQAAFYFEGLSPYAVQYCDWASLEAPMVEPGDFGSPGLDREQLRGDDLPDACREALREEAPSRHAPPARDLPAVPIK